MNIKEMLANPATISGGEAIDKGIKWVRSTGAKFDAMVHGIAVAIIVHAKDTGDCSRMAALVTALPKSARRAALIRWATHFSPINVSQDKKTGAFRSKLRRIGDKNYNPFNVDGARVNPYYDWDKSEDNALAALLIAADVNDNVLKMADRFQSKLDDGKVAPADVPHVTAKVAALRQVATVIAA
jgi:hypothetical protein